MAMDGRALVGREREVAALDAALADVTRGRRPVLLFSGEPGIGKTRLLEELATRAVAAGATVAWGRVWEVGLTPPFWPWLEILAAIETPDDAAPALGSLDTTAGAPARLMRFGQVRAFLLRRAALAPLVLLFDDAHAADVSSLELLEWLLRELAGRPVLVALAARDADASRESVAQLARILRVAARHPLARLGLAEVEALVADRAPTAEVFALSEGNPLFVEELVASHRAHGTLGLPRLSSARAVILDRVARLPEPTREALAAAAIVGRDFRGRVLAEMTGARDIATCLEPALALGMVGVAGPDAFRFSHALVAEAIAGELEPSVRVELHLAAARAVRAHTPGEMAAIAHHLLAAGPVAAADAAVACEQGAREASARLAFEDAAGLLERALSALDVAAPDARLRRAELLCLRAEALQHASRHAAALEACDAALDLVRDAETPMLPGASSGPLGESPRPEPRAAFGELFARIALARGLELQPGLTDPRLVALLSEALARLAPEHAVWRAKLLARLAAAEQPALEPEGPVGRAFEAIELAARLAPRDRLEVLYVATAALVEYVDAEQLTRLHREVLELARGDRWVSVHTRLRACFAALDRQDRAAFDTERRAFEAEAAALGLPQWTRHVHLLRALVALLEGDFALAEREARASEAISTSLGDAGALWRLNVHHSMAAWTRTAPPDPAVAAQLRPPVGRAAIAAWLAVQAGDGDAVRVALAALGRSVSTDPDFALMHGIAVAFVGDAAEAERVYALLAARAIRPVLASMVGSAILDFRERVLLVLATVARRFDAIDAHARLALEHVERLGSPVWAARIHADHADALDARALEGDLASARECRHRALETARRFGMPGLIERCRAALERSGEVSGSERAPLFDDQPKPAPAGAPASPAPLCLTRRGALWHITGYGEQVVIKDSRGIQMVARLVLEPGRPLHVLELSGAFDADSPVDGGHSGPLLDAAARQQYRERLVMLARQRDETEAHADRGRIERANAEIEALESELERAFGLGGRERKVGSASERARSNVQRRITHALQQIRAASPRLGEHLAESLRTGTHCCYAPRER
jgi:hypothetical protein